MPYIQQSHCPCKCRISPGHPGHDSGRQWRKADDYEAEGFQGFKQKFGENAFGLNHRFYLHYDSENRMWLSAEDGCEGTPSPGKGPLRSIFGF